MRPTDLQYRNATEDDMDQVRELLASVRGDRTELICKQVLLACTKAMIVGCVRIREWATGDKELASLAVATEWQNQGIGSTLVSIILRREMSRPLYLLCGHDKSTFYTPHGFRVVGIDELPLTLRGEYWRVMRDLALPKGNVVAMALAR